MFLIAISTEQKKDEYIVSAEEAFNTYSDMVWRLALTRLGAPHYADDVLQDVFMSFIRKKPKFTNEEHLKAWLLRVTINCSNSLVNSTWNKKKAELTETFGEEMETKSDVYYEVLKLPDKYKTAIHLHYYEGYSVEEIAKICGATVTGVKTWLHRGRNMLKETMKGEDFDV